LPGETKTETKLSQLLHKPGQFHICVSSLFVSVNSFPQARRLFYCGTRGTAGQEGLNIIDRTIKCPTLLSHFRDRWDSNGKSYAFTRDKTWSVSNSRPDCSTSLTPEGVTLTFFLGQWDAGQNWDAKDSEDRLFWNLSGVRRLFHLSPLCIDNPRQLDYLSGGRYGPRSPGCCCQNSPGIFASPTRCRERTYWRKPHHGAFKRSGRRGVPQRVGNV
jgi:hypothetical protein